MSRGGRPLVVEIDVEKVAGVKQKLRELAKAPKKVCGAQNLVKELSDDIEGALSVGHSKSSILEILKASGAVMSEATLERYLRRARKERKPGRQRGAQNSEASGSPGRRGGYGKAPGSHPLVSDEPR